ncbi:class I SAM-dependent methyltransferase [Thiogranum longum]
MKTLDRCPACDSGELIPIDFPTDLKDHEVREFGSVVIKDSGFALCARCQLLFARNRQDRSDAVGYYDAFSKLEKREYAVYPPPREFLDAQNRLSDYLFQLLGSEAGVLEGKQSVLNIRSECGMHLARLRDDYGFKELYGLDHFESNIRYAKENLGLVNMGLLHPFELEIPFDRKQFDLILCNHLVTHAFEPMSLLAHLRQLLSEDGAVVLYNEIDHMPRFYEGSLYKKGVVNFHKQLLTEPSLHNMCLLGGFQPKMLACNPEKIRWASNRGSMVFLLRKGEAIAPDALPPFDRKPVLDAIAEGRAKYDRHLERKAKKAETIPLYKTVTSVKRWLRRRV